MTTSEILGFGFAVLSTVVACTWVLAGKLGDIKTALEVHVAETAERIKSIENNVIELKKRSGGPRARR